MCSVYGSWRLDFLSFKYWFKINFVLSKCSLFYIELLIFINELNNIIFVVLQSHEENHIIILVSTFILVRVAVDLRRTPGTLDMRREKP